MGTHQSLNKFIQDLNRIYKNEPALYEVDFSPEGFQWIDANDAANSTFTFIRYAKDRSEFVVVAMNMTPVPRMGLDVGVPQSGYYQELLNSDAEVYGGSNIGNLGGIHTSDTHAHGFQQSIKLSLPPLGLVIMKYQKPE